MKSVEYMQVLVGYCIINKINVVCSRSHESFCSCTASKSSSYIIKVFTRHAGAGVVQVVPVVVPRALLRVAEHAVGLAHLLEAALLLAPLGLWRARVPVRVVHQRALPAAHTHTLHHTS